MSIGLDRALRHMAWSNQAVFSAVSELPTEALDSFITNPEWTVREILHHICDGAIWYIHRLEIENWQLVPEINSMEDVKELTELIGRFDQKLIQAANQEDRELIYRFEEEHRVVARWYSTILTQAIHHATEHRAQLVDALDYKGFKTINLDKLDLWAFDMVERGEQVI
jgi:uncharacterized damage-inducible protein DinB